MNISLLTAKDRAQRSIKRPPASGLSAFDRGPAKSAAADSLNGSARARPLLQMRHALDRSPRVQAVAALQRALNPTPPRDAGTAFRDATRGGGSTVPYRAAMEHAFGQDFSGVQAHLGQAEPMAAIGAHAATHGETIAFAADNPDRETVAHELTHVAQQRQTPGSGATPSGVTSAGVPAEREAETLAPRAAANAQVQVAAPAGTGLHLVRYKVGDLVTIDGSQKGEIIGLGPENPIDDLQKYKVRNTNGKEMMLSGVRLALEGGGEEVEEEEKFSAESGSLGLGMASGIELGPMVGSLGPMFGGLEAMGLEETDPRFEEAYNDLKLDLALLLTSLGHEAQTASRGNTTNLRGKLAEMMVQNMLTERHAEDENIWIMQDRKVGVPNEMYGVQALADIDHMIVEETEDELLAPRALVETKSGTDDPKAVRRQLQRTLEQLQKTSPTRKSKGERPQIYATDETDKPSEVETEMYDLSDLRDIALLTAGPRRGESEEQFDIPLPFTAEEMQAFTNYVVRRYMQLTR